MPRGLTSAVKAELATNNFVMAHLIKLDFASPLYVTDYVSSLTSGGNTYLPIGNFLDIASPQETQELRVGTVNLTLSGVEQSYITAFLTQSWINRKVFLDRAIINQSTGAIIPDPFRIFEGQMTQFQITENDKKSDVVISISSHWADFNKKAGRHTNNNSQQFYFAGDLGFQYASSIIKDIKWGRG